MWQDAKEIITRRMRAIAEPRHLCRGLNTPSDAGFSPYTRSHPASGFYIMRIFIYNKCVSCQNARVNSTKNRVMKNQKTLSCSFNLNRKNN